MHRRGVPSDVDAHAHEHLLQIGLRSVGETASEAVGALARDPGDERIHIRQKRIPRGLGLHRNRRFWLGYQRVNSGLNLAKPEHGGACMKAKNLDDMAEMPRACSRRVRVTQAPPAMLGDQLIHRFIREDHRLSEHEELALKARELIARIL